MGLGLLFLLLSIGHYIGLVEFRAGLHLANAIFVFLLILY